MMAVINTKMYDTNKKFILEIVHDHHHYSKVLFTLNKQI